MVTKSVRIVVETKLTWMRIEMMGMVIGDYCSQLIAVGAGHYFELLIVGRHFGIVVLMAVVVVVGIV